MNTKISKNKLTMPKIMNPRKQVIPNNSKEGFKNYECEDPKLLHEHVVIYQSKTGDFLNQGDGVTLMNKHNVMTNSCLTIAKYGGITNEETVVKDSSNITQLIGQSNYELIFSVLCSVINQELKVRALIALLTIPKKKSDASTQTDSAFDCKIKSVDSKLVQTEESSMIFFTKAPVKRKRKKFNAYTVKDTPEPQTVRKIIIQPENFSEFTRITSNSNSGTLHQKDIEQVSNESALPILHLDEDSCDSIGPISIASVNMGSDIVKNPYGILENRDKVTQHSSPIQPLNEFNNQIGINSTTITLLDNTKVNIPWKIEDHFHIVTPQLIKHIPRHLQNSFVLYQLYIDWKYCLVPNTDEHLPIHVAALNGDIDLLKRQCAVLKVNGSSVDTLTGDKLSALQISIYGDNAACTSELLRAGADPLILDDNYKTCFHLAAEAAPDHLKVLLNHCKEDPLSILEDNEELWNQNFASKPKDFLSNYLLKHISTSFDVQGNTPLMLATSLGRYENVKTLLEAIPTLVNTRMPNSGNTPLFLAVSSAYQDCIARGDKSIVSPNFIRTIEILIEYGADLNIQNHSGVDVNTLLGELDMRALSTLIVDKIQGRVTGVSSPSGVSTVKPLILVRDDAGCVTYCDVKSKVRYKYKEAITDPDEIIQETRFNQVLTKCERANRKESKDSKDDDSILKKETLEKSHATLSDLRSHRKADAPIDYRENCIHSHPLEIDSPSEVNIKSENMNTNTSEASETKPIILKQDIIKEQHKVSPEKSIGTGNNKTFISTFQQFLDTSTNNTSDKLHEHNESTTNPSVSADRQNILGTKVKPHTGVLKLNVPLGKGISPNSASIYSKRISNDITNPKKHLIIVAKNTPKNIVLRRPIPVAAITSGNDSGSIQTKAPITIISKMNNNTSDSSIFSQSKDNVMKMNASMTLNVKRNALENCIPIRSIAFQPQTVITNPKMKTEVVTKPTSSEIQNIASQSMSNRDIASNSILPVTFITSNNVTKTFLAGNVHKAVLPKSVCASTNVVTANASLNKANTSELKIAPLISSINTTSSNLHTISSDSKMSISRKRYLVTPKLMKNNSTVKRVKK
ncbi:hypothetical protein ACJJTC_019207 [Scirpophaga incertulas]